MLPGAKKWRANYEKDHLTLKVDYLCALNDSRLLPHGPRIYFGFLFYH